uniref:Putative group i salivary lipocalin n=1 Tax=Rhipicephalus pulchellus TaxID=72859 RepID=L7LRT4_RHIPC
MILFARTLVLTLAVGMFFDVLRSSEALERPSMEQLIEAMRADQITGLKKRSFDGNGRQCVYSTNTKLDGKQCEFDYGYRRNGTFTTQHFYCTLSDSDNGPVISVRSEKEQGKQGHAREYTLRHLDIEERCGILTHREGVEERCQQFVWSDYIEGEVPKCDKVYAQICKVQNTQIVYESSCQESQ